MTKLPFELEITLRQGTVYKAQHRNLSSPLPHYLVVLNPSPTSSKILILSVFSSKVNQTKLRRKNEPKQTIVELEPDEYSELSVSSVIDCNSLKELSTSELVVKYQSKQIIHCADLPNEIIKKIIEGVKASRLVSPKQKRLLD